MSDTQDRTAQRLFAAARLLEGSPGGVGRSDLWRGVSDAVPLTEDEQVNLRRRQSRGQTSFLYDTTKMVKAGWLFKDKGQWHLTGPGRRALRTHADPRAFVRAMNEAYAFWSQNRGRFERVRDLVEAVPEDSWVAVSDLTAETGLEAAHIVHWLQGERPEGWHRVLDDDGTIPDEAEASEDERQRWLRLLHDDGVDTVLGGADRSRRIPGSELRELVAEEPADGPSGTEASRRAWLVRGSNVQGTNLVRDLWLPQGVCSLQAVRLRELPTGASREQVKAAIDEDYGYASVHERARLVAEYHAFLSRMRPGDLVMTNDGSRVYLGELTGPPTFVSSVSSRANLQRPVTWRNVEKPLDYGDDLPDEISTRVANPDADVIELTDFVSDLEQLLGETPEVEVPQRAALLPDATAELARDLLFPQEWLQECVELLRDRPQLILYGPPGTGKTHLAQRLAAHLAGGKPENVQLVQFHPAYSYEDFFEGYRPSRGGDGALTFDLSRGPMRTLADAAETHPGEPHVLIIDEINRGNLAKIFGELYFLLEYRGQRVNLLYGSDEGKGFFLPRNLVIIGTMNTADRSIALVDAAMRRRFWFVELHPDEPPARDLLSRWLEDRDYSQLPARLLSELNTRIEDRDFKIGPSYLMREAAQSPAGLERIWRTQILPLLEEHHYGEYSRDDVAQRYGLDALRRGIGTDEGTAPEAPTG